MLKLNYVDFSIVIIFLLSCLTIGLYKTTQIKTFKEFALGYKNISVTVLVCIIFASSIGAGSTIGVTGRIYEFGAIYIIGQLLVPLSWIIITKIITRNFEQFKDCVTLSEIMFRLYGAPGRWVVTFASTLHSLGYIAAQALALGFVFNYFLGIETGYGILIGYGIITIYSVLGGIRAVIHTEIFKFAIFFFIIPISYIVIFSKAGGLESLISYLPESHLNIKLSNENIRLLASFALYFLLPGVDPAFIQRCLIAKDAKQLEKALKMIALISFPFSAALCLIAYKMKLIFPNIQPDETLLKFISLLPPVLKGIMVSGLMAIIMSVAEAKINATSIILINDVLKVLIPKISNASQLIALKVTTIVLAVSSLALIKLSSGILALILLVSNFWEPLVSIPTISGFLGFRTNGKSFIASIISAVVFTFIGRVIAGEFAIISITLGDIGSAIGLFGMHYYQISMGQIERQVQIKTIYSSLVTKIQKISLKPIKIWYKKLKNIISLFMVEPGKNNIEIQRFCTFTLSYYFLYSLYITSNPGHEIFAYLITIGYFLCMVLLFREFIVSKEFLNKYLHLYWYFLLTFCLPFMSSYMLFVSQGDDFWVINGILSAFSLYLFVDARRFLLLYSIGIVCGFILFKQSGYHLGLFQEITTTSRIAYIYLFFLFVTLFFLRKREREQEERVETMHMFGGAMAHEVKSPLATMNMCADTVHNLFQIAFNTKQEEGEFYNFKLHKHDAHTLLEFSDMLKKISSRGIDTVNNLLTSLKSNVIADDKKVHLIEDCITQAILEYELSEPQKYDITIKIIDNFSFYGSMHYTKHIIFNLLINAYKYGGRNIKIDIWAQNHQLYFQDNGKGIAEEDLPFIFDRFYSKSKSGIGIGLAFCKMVMEDIGGSIDCKSELGKYTKFILSFPKPKKKKKKLTN